MPKVKVKCDYCGKEFEKYPTTITPHNFCSRACLGAFSSKSKNPEGYHPSKTTAGKARI